ncbi:MAG: RNA polymerase sigma factor [Pirellulales bacterium]
MKATGSGDQAHNRVASFATTQWSIVVRAGQRKDAVAESALAELCRRYWFPLYAYVRRRTRDAGEAQDLTQEFFARLLEKQTLAEASPDRGRFRSFLLTSMKNFLANDRDRAGAQKRGGHVRQLSLDWQAGESRLSYEPADHRTPEDSYERQWALTLLDQVVARLQGEFAAAGKSQQFELLKGALTGDRSDLPYAKLAPQLGVSDAAARKAAQRLRDRYREMLREEIARTVADPADVQDEIRRLFELLAK